VYPPTGSNYLSLQYIFSYVVAVSYNDRSDQPPFSPDQARQAFFRGDGEGAWATLWPSWDTQVIAFTHPTHVRGGENYIRIDYGNALTCVSHVSHDLLQSQPLAAALAVFASVALASLAPGLRAMPL